MLEKMDCCVSPAKTGLLKSMYILVWLKLYLVKFHKVVLTHPDNATESQIFSTNRIGLSVLCMIESPRSVFDPELEQYEVVEERHNKNKKVKRGYEMYRAVKLSMFSPLDKESAGRLLTCL